MLYHIGDFSTENHFHNWTTDPLPAHFRSPFLDDHNNDLCHTVKSIIRSCPHATTQNSVSSRVVWTFSDVVSCVQDLNKASRCSVFVTRWISSLRPETSRWSEERNRRGREAKRRLPRLHAGRRKVQRELTNSCLWPIDLEAGQQTDFVCLP